MNRKAAVLVIVVFVLGIALGGLSMHLAADRGWTGHAAGKGHGSRAQMVEQMTRELSLTPEQQKSLETILDDTRSTMRAIHEQVRPQFEEVRQQGRQKIRAILTPEQLPQFEEFIRRLDEERKKRESR